MLLSLRVHGVLFAWTQEEWKTRTSFPCSWVSFLSPLLPLGCFAWTWCFAGCFFQAFSCYLLALHTVSLGLLHHRKLVISYWEMVNWWREAVKAEWQGVFCTIHNKCTKLDVPVTHIHPHVSSLWHLSLLGLVLFSITPFCQILQSFFLPKQGDFQQTMGLSLGGRLLID